MPELPEVEALAGFLDSKLRGRYVERVELASIAALKTFDPPLDALRGRSVRSVGRRGKFLLIELGPEGSLWMVLHLARGGWIRWRDQITSSKARPGRGPLALRAVLEDGGGLEVTEAGTEKRVAVWVVADPAEVAPLAAIGPDPLAPSFDLATMSRALTGQSGRLKGVLTDQSVIAGIGNAYSDEILHAARLSPFKPAGNLSDEEIACLFEATRRVLGDAVERSSGQSAASLKPEKRAGMRVHGRTGEPCPVCGTAIREVAFSGKSLQYCPRCQTGGKPLADRRLSRLLR